MFRTIFPSIIRSSKLHIRQQACVQQLLLPAASVPLAAGSSNCLTYACWRMCTLSSWWWTERPSESCRAFYKNKWFEKQVHLVGCTIRKTVWVQNLVTVIFAYETLHMLIYNYMCYKSNYAINSYSGRLRNWRPSCHCTGQVNFNSYESPTLYAKPAAHQQLTERSVLLSTVPYTTSVSQYMPIRCDYGFRCYTPLHYSLY